jgi:hypothetical protein
MSDDCIKRRLLFACRQAYADGIPAAGKPVGWIAPPRVFHSANRIDRVLVGRVPEGIVVAFRGTLPPFSAKDGHPSAEVATDWLNNVDMLSRTNGTYPGRVHKGFAASVERLWSKTEQAIRDLLKPDAKANRLYVTGHSKGGALANLAAWRALGIKGLAGPIRVVTIAAARAGNADFRAAVDAHGGIDCTRYETPFDVVPLVPFGADTPPWAKLVVRKVWPNLLDNNYVPIGRRMPLKSSEADMLAAIERYAGWLLPGSRKSAYAPLLVQAHDISAGSGYDRLVCLGEGGCKHA